MTCLKMRIILLLQENKISKAIEGTVGNEYVHIMQRSLIKHMYCKRLVPKSKQCISVEA
jgi:hypothetical protein